VEKRGQQHILAEKRWHSLNGHFPGQHG